MEASCSVRDSSSNMLRPISDGDGKVVAYQRVILLFHSVAVLGRCRRIEAAFVVGGIGLTIFRSSDHGLMLLCQ